MSAKVCQEQADKALCRLINIFGYSNSPIEQNKELFSDVTDFLCTLNACLVKKKNLTRVHHSNNIKEDKTAPPFEESICSKRINIMNDIEQTLLARIPRDEYNQLIKK